MQESAFELRARWVIPIDRPAIAGGYVLVRDGNIAAVSDQRQGGAKLIDMGDIALLPGFVNAHTHLELTCYRGRLAAAPLWDWFVELLKLRRLPGAAEAERAAVRQGAAESVAAGVTCIGDISRTAHHAQALANCAIRAVCFCELISGAAQPPMSAAQVGELVERLSGLETDNLRLGYSPHAPYTVTPEDMAECGALANQSRALTIHVLETPEERDWMLGKPSSIQDLLEMHNLPARHTNWNRGVLAFLQASGILRPGTLLAHANYVDDDDLDVLAQSGASVVWCPRAHAYYGHQNHRWRDMLAAGIPVCIGTDSAAASGTLSILDELRYLHAAHPDFSPERLLRMGTLSGAEALGWSGRIGSIAPGKSADLVGVTFASNSDDDPTRAVLASEATVTWVCHNGEIGNFSE